MLKDKIFMKGIIPPNPQYTILLDALLKADNVDSFSVDHKNKQTQIFIGDWSLELSMNGTWKIV